MSVPLPSDVSQSLFFPEKGFAGPGPVHAEDPSGRGPQEVVHGHP